jgi:hypothetical protein
MAPPRRLLAAIALVALIGAGCSNAPAETGGGGDQNAPAGATPNPAELQELQKKLPEYAKCMRENGVEDFPDPGADGTIQYYGDTDPQEFTSASEKCDDLLPPDRGQNR